jgi:peptidoglycan hydrolase CwlO-like protein
VDSGDAETGRATLRVWLVVLAVVAAALGQPAVAVAEPRPPSTAAAAAALRRQVEELTAKAERLAAAADAEQARLDALAAGATVRQRQLDEAEQALAQADAGYREQVRDLYVRGPLAPFEALLAAGDPAALTLASRVAAAAVDERRAALDDAQANRDLLERALTEVRDGQAELRASAGRLAARRAALAADLGAVQALLAQADAELRRALEAERARRLAAHRAAVEAAQAGAGLAAGRGRRCDLSGTSADERYIIEHESGGDPTAANPTSSAFGLGQLLLDMRLRYLGTDYATTDCGAQLAAFRAYVGDRYGTAERAAAFWRSHHWY